MDAQSKRINRIIGQLKGIEKMVLEKRDCMQILQQISAVKKAIDGFSREVVTSTITKHVPEDRIKEVAGLIEKAIHL